MRKSLPAEFRSGCPIASTLDLLGDRWSLVLVRDMLSGKSRFGEFLQSPERIPTNILAQRLAQLEDFGLVERRRYREHPPRYEYLLTASGRALLPVLQSVCRWANSQLPGTWTPPISFMGQRF